MDKPRTRPFRAYIQILTTRSRPEPIFVVAFTSTDRWLRIEVPTDVLIRSPRQRQREISRLMREHYAVWGERDGPFGRPTGYVFHSLPDRATRYDVNGVAVGGSAPPPTLGRATLGLRRRS